MRIRAACHVHSDWSYDGKWSLPEIAAGFSRRGYQVVMITEHDQGFDESRRQKHREACRQASTEKILLVPGIEYSDVSNTLHFLVWDNVPFIGTGLTADEILKAAQNTGAIVVFAHPSRRNAWKLFDPAWADKLAGIEVWNRKTDGWAPSRDAWPLLRGLRAQPFVGMDFHDPRQFFSLATIMEVESSISEETVLAAIRAGRCASEAFGCAIRRFSEGIVGLSVKKAESLRRTAATFTWARKLLKR
jgi:hypothetical protein